MTDPGKRMSLQKMRDHPWLAKAYESLNSSSVDQLEEQKVQ